MSISIDRLNVEILKMTWTAPAPPKNIMNVYRNKLLLKSTNNSYVYQGFQIRPHVDVILKYIPLQGENQQIDQECSIQSSLEFKYVMPLQKIFEFEKKYRVLVMDVAKGSLVSGYAEKFFKTPLQVFKIMYQITKGLAFLHDHQILHGDIKPSNVVIMDDDEYMPFPRIIDFGHAQILHDDLECNCHRLTDAFSSPELLMLQPHSYASDIFALGATFYFLITEEYIIPGCMSRERRANEIKIMHPLAYTNRFGPNFPETGKKLIKSMLDPDPFKRPTANQVLESEFFRTEVLSDQAWVNKEELFLNTAKASASIENELANTYDA